MKTADPPPGHSWHPADVTLHLVHESPRLVSRAEKEALIADGVSYGELLEREAAPNAVQERAYADALARTGERLGAQLASLAAHLSCSGLAHAAGPVTLVSLPRAGLPVGAVLGRVLRAWGVDAEHHSVSIVRGVGLDRAALDAVVARRGVRGLVFVDGWTGKGSIQATLRGALRGHPAAGAPLAVVSDPARAATLAATFEDDLLPHAALNATVSGLLSRTFLASGGRHGAVTWGHLAGLDRTNAYLDALTASALAATPAPLPARPAGPDPAMRALELARLPGQPFDPHKVKPSVGEATRVFLRRHPARLLVRDAGDPEVAHLLALAAAGGVSAEVCPALPYRAVAVAR